MRRNAMLKRLLVIIGITVALLSGCSTNQADEYAMVMFYIGDATKNNAPLTIGDIISQSDVIRTGKDSFCDIRIGGSVVRIKENSKVVMSTLTHNGDEENTALGLDVGKILCKPKRLIKSENFMVKTPTAVAAVRGTQFIVEADSKETTRIKVFAGKLKIAKRIQELEGSVDKILAIAPELEEHEKVIITKRDVDNAQKVVRGILLKETGKGEEKAIAVAIDQAKGDILVNKSDISKFAAADFSKESDEIIKIKERPREVIHQIVKVIQQEKEMPKPDGRLLITRYEVYFIKGGKVIWEGRVVNPPLKWNNKLYIAAENYVFCATDEGPVVWRKNMQNDGKVEIKENKLVIFSQGNESVLDPETGQQQ
jgi:hypothetical protein